MTGIGLGSLFRVWEQIFLLPAANSDHCASLLPMWSLLLFCWWSSMCLSVGGGLHSFRLMISSPISLILCSRAFFSSSYLFFMWWMWDVQSCNTCSISSFNRTVFLSYSSTSTDSFPFLSSSLLTVSCSSALAQSFCLLFACVWGCSKQWCSCEMWLLKSSYLRPSPWW